MRRALITVVVITCTLLVIVGCKKGMKDKSKFIEYIEVKGLCYEDHVEHPVIYSGAIVHWHNISKNIHSRYGSVEHVDAMDPEKFMKNVDDPYEYKPPFTIEFSELTEEEINKDILKIKGISEHLGNYNWADRPRYSATCELKVIRRLDYLPSAKEQGNIK